MNIKIYTSGKDNKVKNISNTYSVQGNKSIYISNNVKILNLNKEDFENVGKIKNVSIGNNCYKIGDNCFQNCTELTCVCGKGSILEIGKNAFAECSKIYNIPLMEYGKTTVGERAFQNCITLIKGEIYGIEGESLTLGQGIYSGCASMKYAHIEREIPKYTFYGCTSLVKCTTRNISSIGDYSFDGCYSLRYIKESKQIEQSHEDGECVDLSKCSTIGECAFRGCSQINQVKVGNSLKELKNNAFHNCTSLQYINLQNSGISYLGNVFQNTALTCLELPKTIENVSQIDSTFLQNTNVQKVYFYGFTDDYVKSKKDEKIWKFGSSNINSIASSSGREYKVNDDGTLKVFGIMVISISLERNRDNTLPGMAKDGINLKNMITQNTEISEEYYFTFSDSGDNKGTTDKILEKLDYAIQEQPSLLLFHFSDHGGNTASGGPGYICTYSGGGYPYYILNQTLAEKFSKIKTRVFVILCCCYPWHSVETISGEGKYLVWAAGKKTETTYMYYNIGHVFIQALKSQFKNGTTYSEQWEKNKSSSDWNYAGRIPQKYNYNGFDEDDILFT